MVIRIIIHQIHHNYLYFHTEDALVSKTHKQQTTQQVPTVTKEVREVKHLEGDGPQVDYVQCL